MFRIRFAGSMGWQNNKMQAERSVSLQVDGVCGVAVRPAMIVASLRVWIEIRLRFMRSFFCLMLSVLKRTRFGPTLTKEFRLCMLCTNRVLGQHLHWHDLVNKDSR